MRKLITGAAIFLIFLSAYVVLKTVFEPHPSKTRSAINVTITPAPDQNIRLVSTAPAPVPSPQLTPEPVPQSKSTLEPLKGRVVKHQPAQFRKGVVGDDELVAITKALKSIPWSLNANPEAAAHEDYSAIVKECEKTGEHHLVEDLIAEAVSNDYQPNNEAANAAYSTQLNADSENGHQSDSSNGKSTGEPIAAQEPGVAQAPAPALNQQDPPAPAASLSPAPGSAPAETTRAKIAHVRHHNIVRRKIVDAKTRLLELWHQSLAQ
jgi:hypothetical protein